MASNVYSTLLFTGTSSSSNQVLQSPTVPTGFVWVVRDVTAYFGQTAFCFAGQFEVRDANGFPICGIGDDWAEGQIWYRWEVRQVIVVSSWFNVFCRSSGWKFRVSGYQLSTP